MDYSELDELISALQETVDAQDPQRGYWKSLWKLVGDVKTGFGAIRYPTVDQRREAWSRFEDLVERARARSEEAKEKSKQRQARWEETERKSRYTRERLEGEAASTAPTTDFQRAIGMLVLAPLIVIERMLRDLLGLEQLDEIKQDLLACSDRLRKGRRR